MTGPKPVKTITNTIYMYICICFRHDISPKHKTSWQSSGEHACALRVPCLAPLHNGLAGKQSVDRRERVGNKMSRTTTMASCATLIGHGLLCPGLITDDRHRCFRSGSVPFSRHSSCARGGHGNRVAYRG